MLDFASLWRTALPYHEFVAASTAHCGLWVGVHKFARLPAWSEGLDLSDGPRRLLVLAEDWCGDASNTIPVLAKLVEAVPGLELRVLRRDEHPAVMDAYLTSGSRSIPIVIALDMEYRELGHWGPRPAELQAWVIANKDSLAKDELYSQARKWYARDRGEATLREVLSIATGLSIPVPGPAPTPTPA
jgi:hypothetical protein